MTDDQEAEFQARQRANRAAIILFAGFLVALTVTGCAFIWTPWPTNILITGVGIVCYLGLYEAVMDYVDGPEA